jgi:hypothetical protein
MSRMQSIAVCAALLATLDVLTDSMRCCKTDIVHAFFGQNSKLCAPLEACAVAQLGHWQQYSLATDLPCLPVDSYQLLPSVLLLRRFAVYLSRLHYDAPGKCCVPLKLVRNTTHVCSMIANLMLRISSELIDGSHLVHKW